MDVNRFSDVTSVNQASDNGTDIAIELTNLTGTYLHHLNEDCLLEIFSSLTPVDLCSLAGTCKRFEQISQRVFPKEINIEVYNEGYELSSNDYWHFFIEPANVECFLKNFGNRLSKLSVFRLDEWFLDSIAKNYDAITLKHLDIDTDFQQKQDSLMHRWDSIYPKITGQLVELVVNLSSQSEWVASSMSKHTFPNLEQFTCQRHAFDYCVDYGVESYAISNEVFLKFFDRHTRLRTLEFTEQRMSYSYSSSYSSSYSPPSDGCCMGYDYQDWQSKEQTHSSYVTHTIVKTSTELGKLTLPNEFPYKIVMYTAPINEPDDESLNVDEYW